MNQAYQVKIDSFEGPLDLLLHLINQYEIDLYDIPVRQITQQYMDYIHTMQWLELNVASEYLVMASELLAMKSQMLLPTQDLETIDDEYEEDPREELMARLIAYRKYKQVATALREKEVHDTPSFTRSPISVANNHKEQPFVKGDVTVYDMLGALNKMLNRKKWNTPMDTTVKRDHISLEGRMDEILTITKRQQAPVKFDDLFSYPSRSYIVVTFMAILELMKNKQIYCKQKKQLETLYVLYGEEEV